MAHTFSKMINDFVCMTSIPRLRCFSLRNGLCILYNMIFCFFFVSFSDPCALTLQKSAAQGGTRAPLARPLYINERQKGSAVHVSSPLLPTICYQRLIKMLTNTRHPSCLKRIFSFFFLSHSSFWLLFFFSFSICWPANARRALALSPRLVGVRIHTLLLLFFFCLGQKKTIRIYSPHISLLTCRAQQELDDQFSSLQDIPQFLCFFSLHTAPKCITHPLHPKQASTFGFGFVLH